MNLVDWFICHTDSKDLSAIGVQWCQCRDRPFNYIAKPDRPYWSYLNVRVLFFRRALWINIRMRQLPYKNKEQYISWLRQNRRAREQAKS
jgi:hypothetical protein